MNEQSEILIYQSEDGLAVTEVRLESETLWLTQAQIADLFQVKPQNITMHLKKIFQQRELDEKATCKDFLQVQVEGARAVTRSRKHYNLDAVISVGYRVNSVNATRFRQWANRVLKEYLTRGYSLNEKLLQEQNRRLSDLRDTVALIEQTLAHQVVGEDEAKGLLKVIAESRPEEKETIIKVIINLINRNNDYSGRTLEDNQSKKGYAS